METVPNNQEQEPTRDEMIRVISESLGDLSDDNVNKIYSELQVLKTMGKTETKE